MCKPPPGGAQAFLGRLLCKQRLAVEHDSAVTEARGRIGTSWEHRDGGLSSACRSGMASVNYLADKEEGGILAKAQTCDSICPGSLTAMCSSDELVKGRGQGITLEGCYRTAGLEG